MGRTTLWLLGASLTAGVSNSFSDPVLAPELSTTDLALELDETCNSGNELSCTLELRQLRGDRLVQHQLLQDQLQLAPKVLPTSTDKVASTVRIPSFVGMAYTAVPTTKFDNPKCDDFMADWSSHIWGPSGRDDLKVMRTMGVDAVRTYGAGSQLQHRAFLDHAHELGLKVIPGFADLPYFGHGSPCGMKGKLPSNCAHTKGGDCFSTIKEHYKQMLLNGYTTIGSDGQRRYHPALFIMTVGNEVELKLHLSPDHARVVISAVDGLLAAEEELGVVGPKPFLTSSVSYATCPKCKSQGMGFPGLNESMPFLPFVADYYYGFKDPKGYLGYPAKHDLFATYTSRWVSSYNTARPASAICDKESQVLKVYNQGPLGSVPIYISEFHHSFLTPEQFKGDLIKVKGIVENEDDGACGGTTNPLIGFNIFEYQISYWKGPKGEGGAAMRYGMWGLGHKSLASTTSDSMGGEPDHPVLCLQPAAPMGKLLSYSDDSNAKSVIQALGGTWPDKNVLC